MFVRLIRTIGKGAKAVHTVRLKIDRTMHGRYSATMLSLLFSFLASIAIAYPLFVPPYVGFANDGSLDYVMQDTSLAQLPGSGYFDYYERTLRIVSHSYAPGTTPWPQVGAIRLAMAVDFAISGDSLFDLRALALIYTLMYIPAVFWTIRLAVQSTRTFIDGVLIAALGALILSDVNLVARFASLYAQPLELILSLYAISGLIAIARKRGGYVLHLLVAAALWLLSQVNPSAGASLFVNCTPEVGQRNQAAVKE